MKWAWAGVIAVAALIGAAAWPLRAQSGGAGAAAKASVQEALLKPYVWAYREETTLRAVVDDLHKRLGAPVVLDRAALTRRKLTTESTVRLELEGVRLKTGLKLLLDQVNLTIHVVPEDNLLILTDAEGAEDPAERALAEARSLHRDLHAVQDDLADLRDFLGANNEEGPVLRKPTIIEEVPADQAPAQQGGGAEAGGAKDMPAEDAPKRPRRGI